MTAATCSGVYSLSAGLWSTGVERGRGGTDSGRVRDPADDDPGLGELFVLLGVEDGSVDGEKVDDEEALDAGEDVDAASWVSTLERKAFASGVGKRAMDFVANFLALE